MKQLAKKLLQSIFGFKTYLYCFSLYKIQTLRRDVNEKIIFSFLDLIPDNSLILDIGANLGFVTYHLAQKRGASVLSFEPIPINAEVLKRVVKSKDLANVTVLPYALGDESGQIDIVMPFQDGVPMQGLSHVPQNGEQVDGYKFTVPLKRLDDLVEIKTSGKRVGGIKIDVEDYEYFVLNGGRELLLRDKPVICIELWANENRDRSLSLLEDLGYRTHILSDGKLVPVKEAGTMDSLNFICMVN